MGVRRVSKRSSLVEIQIRTTDEVSRAAVKCLHPSRRKRAWMGALAAILLIATCCMGAYGQGVPTITSLSPATATAGGAAFTLTVNGTGYVATSSVEVNGVARTTTFVSATQLTAQILASDIATAGTVQITIFNPSLVAAGGTTSAPFPLAIAAATLPAPVLTSAAPGLSAQGAGRLQVTLQGANFRPGATVILSPPLANVTNSNGHTPATDVTLVQVNRISATLMTATFSLSPTATIGLRGIDVLNSDGTSTAVVVGNAAGSGTTQPFQIEPSTSLAAPPSVLDIALIHPRDGTVVAQGDELYAQAVLSGAGTGSLIGQWLWDNRVIEQFAVPLVAGQSMTIRTRQSLPTWYLGAHTVQLRMQQPSQIATRPVTVAVNPPGWKLEALLAPAYGAAFGATDPPVLLWAPVPGAVRYQVGFSTQPFYSAIVTWYDVDENRWQVPLDVWRKQGDGNLYWTVRAIQSPGVPRKPLPMRRIVHLGENALAPSTAAPVRNALGHAQIAWNLVSPGALYLVSISSDAEGTRILRRYLTDKSVLDLHAIEGRLVPGEAYFWRADAFSAWGDLIDSGQAQRFIDPPVPGPTTYLRLPSHGPPLRFVNLTRVRRGGSYDLTAEIGKETPAPNSSVSLPQPVVSVQFQTPVNPVDVSLSMDDVDITSLSQVSQTQVSYTPQLPLANGEHDISLMVGAEASGWKFTVAAAAPATPATPATTVLPGTDAEAAPLPAASTPLAAMTRSAAAAAKTPAKAKFEGEIDGQITSTTQWASGSNPPDSNVFSLAERMMTENSAWKPELNGSGLLNSILNPAVQRTAQGRVNDYIAQVERKGERWGIQLRFGIVSPALFTDAQFVTAATPRQGVEAMATTPGGTLGFYTNTNDVALGGGAGVTFHQRLMGASWQAPLPKWAEFRLMWLGARDIGAPTTVEYDSQGNPIIVPNPVAAKSRGDVYGGLLNLHLGKVWQWSSEYAWSYDNANLSDPSSTTLFGRAWRTGISGNPGKASVSVAFRDLSANFANPANPSLTQASNPNLRGLDASASESTKAGSFAATYSYLQNNVNPTTTAEIDVNTFSETWSKPFGASTSLSVGANQSLTETGTIPAALRGLPPSQNGSADQRDVSGNITLTRQVGLVSMNAGASRDWLRDNIQSSASAITSSISVGANLITRGFFQCNTQANFNWVAANPSTIGTTRNISVYVQPAFTWKEPNLQLSPLLSIAQARTLLASGSYTSKTLAGQYGGRLAWTLPAWLKTSTLAVQGSYNQNRDDVANIDTPSTQLVAIWTFNLAHKKTF